VDDVDLGTRGRETLIFQALPIFIVRMLKGSIRFQILVSTLLFSAAHFPEGIATGLSAGVSGGLYFAFSAGTAETVPKAEALAPKTTNNSEVRVSYMV
jgi:hypothetical protein